MDIETGDSLPISQKPYNLSLKYTTWVHKELETLEKAGIIVQSVLLGPVPSWLSQNELNLEISHEKAVCGLPSIK